MNIFGTGQQITEFFQVVKLGLGVGIFSGVRKHGTVYDKLNLQPGIAIHQSNKRKWA